MPQGRLLGAPCSLSVTLSLLSVLARPFCLLAPAIRSIRREIGRYRDNLIPPPLPPSRLTVPVPHTHVHIRTIHVRSSPLPGRQTSSGHSWNTQIYASQPDHHLPPCPLTSKEVAIVSAHDTSATTPVSRRRSPVLPLQAVEAGRHWNVDNRTSPGGISYARRNLSHSTCPSLRANPLAAALEQVVTNETQLLDSFLTP